MPRRFRRDTVAARRRWLRAQRAEIQFARALRLIANKCGAIARRTFDPVRPMGSLGTLRRELERYGETLGPWSRATAARMVADVARRDEAFWYEQSNLMSRNLRQEIRSAPTGIATRERAYEAAGYISSLPLEAAQRVEQLAVEYMTRGIRANELASRIVATGQVTKSRANTIARTETSRTAGLLQEVRAQSVGSVGYIWRTVGDIDVRDRHERLEGRFFRWDAPPITGENGERSHPGGIYNCRCWAEVVLPGETRTRRGLNYTPANRREAA
jgi:SPP1 gp7 family putative phage head morphogenesis protein